MSNQLAKIDFTKEQVELIKTQIAPSATNDELKLFLYQAKRTGLDPLTRQIYCIHRNQYNPTTRQSEPKMTIQTSIDGFRVIAERSGDYGGQDEPLFVTDDNGNLIYCKIAVYRFRGDVRYQASVGVAYWEEYAQRTKNGDLMGLWAKMPHTMLSKVAEALALRKAYPQDLSGLYTTEEMAQADVTPVVQPIVEVKAEIVNDLTKEDYVELQYILDQCQDIESLKEIWDSLDETYQKDKKVKQMINQSKIKITNK
jgi:phage recombination protein Bet